MTYENLILDIEGGVATVKIHRPKALNALNAATLDDLIAVGKELSVNDAIKVVIVTGEGTKAFVAGADIQEMQPLNAVQGLRFSQKGHEALSIFERLTKPVIAAVNGYALGGGFELALCCDIIYASEKARVGFPEVTLGILPGFGGTQRLTRLVGPARAKELVLTGKMISAREAFDMGLFNKIVPDDELMGAVKDLAGVLLAAGPFGVRLAKDCINKSSTLDIDSGLDYEARAFGLCFGTEDQKEGMGAFLEKRTPTFRGQ